MTDIVQIQFKPMALDGVAQITGKLALLIDPDGKLDPAARRINGLTRKTIDRILAGPGWTKAKTGQVIEIAFPAGLAAEALLVVKLPRKCTLDEARNAGAGLARHRGEGDLLVLAGAAARAADLAFGLVLRSYDFSTHKTAPATPVGGVTVMIANPEAVAKQAAPMAAVAEGVFFTRDLINEPANILTTDDFAARLAAMQDLGLDVEILEEADLEKLGMGSLLCVGQGSVSPSKVVVMHWRGGGDEAPFALVGKGVVFDTGGISIKPAGGMEDMTCDMGGAGVVAGVMRTLALRKARANVVGLDADASKLEIGREAASRLGVSVDFRCVDLIDTWPELGTFDVVLLFNYLDRPRMPEVRKLVVPGGLLIMETYLEWQRTQGWGPTSDDHLLEPGELARLVGPLEPIHGREVFEPVENNKVRAVASIVAQRMHA